MSERMRGRGMDGRRAVLALLLAAWIAPPLVLAQANAAGTPPEWAGTLERIAGSVVAIKVDQTRAFDTEWNTSSQATGFVVDAERGLILTNRHVVTPGPVTPRRSS
jgi:pro-apoptotic serine protease NMA111